MVFFLLRQSWLWFLARMRLSVWILKFQTIIYVSFLEWILDCAFTIYVLWSNFNLLHNSQLITNYYFTPWQFFTALADDFLLECEWQQVSSSLLDSSQYSGRSQQWCSLDSLHPSRYFQVLQSLYQSTGDCIKNFNYNWYNRHSFSTVFF